MMSGEKKAVSTTKKTGANPIENDGIPMSFCYVVNNARRSLLRRPDMLKQVLRLRVVLVILLMLTLFCPGAFARGDDKGGNKGGNKGYSRSDNRGYNRGDRHYYRNGRWYRRGWFGFEFVVSVLAIGAFIDSLPPRHTTVVVESTPYYHDDRYYYRQLPEGGYVVVPAPVIVQPQSQIPETSTVNIPNSRGGYTSVTLRKSGNGFVGPQGEYYADSPTVDQLRVLYGN
jgi:hypothetical protein